MNAAARALLLLSLLLAPAAAPAQDAPAPPERDPEATLDALKGCDPNLLGTTPLAFVLDGGQPIGQGTWTVERAPGGSGGVYRVLLRVSLGPPSARSDTREEVLLDERLAVVEATYQEAERRRSGVHRTLRRRVREGDVWVERATAADGTERVRRLTAPGPHHGDLSALLLLARKLDRSAPGRLRLTSAWFPPERPTADGAPPEPRPAEVQPIAVEVLTPEEVTWHGRAVRADRVRLTRPGDAPTVVWLSPTGDLLQFGPEGFALRVVAGTEAELSQDRPTAPAPAADPAAAVRTWLEVLAGQAPARALDRVLDWEAVHRQAAVNDPSLRDLDPALYAALFKARLEGNPPALDADGLARALASLEVTREGDAATAVARGETLRLRRTERGWRIVALPD